MEWNAYFDWCLGSSKRGSSRVSSLQETNKKLLETISEVEKAANTDCQVACLVGLGSHVWQLCHLAFDFWASLCLLFHLELDSLLVKFWFGLVWLVCLSVQTSSTNYWS